MSNSNELINDDSVSKQKESKEEKLTNSTARIFDNVILSGEEIKMSFKPLVWRVYLINLLKPFVVYFLSVLLFLALYFNPSETMTKADSLVFLYCMSGMILLLELITFLITKKGLKNIYYVITNKRVISSFGIFNIDYEFIDLDKIKDVNLTYNFSDKLLFKKSGQITFYPVGKELKSVHFYCVDKPLESYVKIEEFMGKNND